MMRSSLRAVPPAARRLWRTGRALLRPSILPLWRAVREGAGSAAPSGGPRRRPRRRPADDEGLVGRALYELWIERFDRLSDRDRQILRARQARLALDTRFSIVIQARAAEPEPLRRTLRTLGRQIYPHWVAFLATTQEPLLPETLLEELRLPPGRVRFLPEPLTLPPPEGLPGAPEYFARLEAGDQLAEHALQLAAEMIRENPAADLLYPDHDEIDAAGRRFRPRFKPDWNADLFTSSDYLGPFVVYRRAAVARRTEPLTASDSGEAELRLALTSATAATTIRHLPEILCHHWRPTERSDVAMASRRSTLTRLLAQRRPGAEILSGARPDTLRVRWPLPKPPPLVSLLIPTRNGLELLEACLASVAAVTRYLHYEIVVIDNGSDDPACVAYLERQEREGRIARLRSEGEFNFSALNNLAARRCGGEVLCFLNNDVEALTPGWLTELVSQALRPDVGAAGAKLLYPDGTVQHGGVLLGGGAPVDAVAGHLFHGLAREDPGYAERARQAQDLSAVTAACLATRREVFDEIGGFDERNLPVAFNDVDLCLRLRQAGYRIVWTPFAELRHHGSASRGDDHRRRRQGFAAEVGYMRRRWAAELERDPFYNPNLDPVRADFSLAFPPRHDRAWRRSAGLPAGRNAAIGDADESTGGAT